MRYVRVNGGNEQGIHYVLLADKQPELRKRRGGVNVTSPHILIMTLK